jgi:hypothetical protein
MTMIDNGCFKDKSYAEIAEMYKDDKAPYSKKQKFSHDLNDYLSYVAEKARQMCRGKVRTAYQYRYPSAAVRYRIDILDDFTLEDEAFINDEAADALWCAQRDYVEKAISKMVDPGYETVCYKEWLYLLYSKGYGELYVPVYPDKQDLTDIFTLSCPHITEQQTAMAVARMISEELACCTAVSKVMVFNPSKYGNEESAVLPICSYFRGNRIDIVPDSDIENSYKTLEAEAMPYIRKKQFSAIEIMSRFEEDRYNASSDLFDVYCDCLYSMSDIIFDDIKGKFEFLDGKEPGVMIQYGVSLIRSENVTSNVFGPQAKSMIEDLYALCDVKTINAWTKFVDCAITQHIGVSDNAVSNVNGILRPFEPELKTEAVAVKAAKKLSVALHMPVAVVKYFRYSPQNVSDPETQLENEIYLCLCVEGKIAQCPVKKEDMEEVEKILNVAKRRRTNESLHRFGNRLYEENINNRLYSVSTYFSTRPEDLWALKNRFKKKINAENVARAAMNHFWDTVGDAFDVDYHYYSPGNPDSPNSRLTYDIVPRSLDYLYETYDEKVVEEVKDLMSQYYYYDVTYSLADLLNASGCHTIYDDEKLAVKCAKAMSCALGIPVQIETQHEYIHISKYGFREWYIKYVGDESYTLYYGNQMITRKYTNLDNHKALWNNDDEDSGDYLDESIINRSIPDIRSSMQLINGMIPLDDKSELYDTEFGGRSSYKKMVFILLTKCIKEMNERFGKMLDRLGDDKNKIDDMIEENETLEGYVLSIPDPDDLVKNDTRSIAHSPDEGYLDSAKAYMENIEDSMTFDMRYEWQKLISSEQGMRWGSIGNEIIMADQCLPDCITFNLRDAESRASFISRYMRCLVVVGKMRFKKNVKDGVILTASKPVIISCNAKRLPYCAFYNGKKLPVDISNDRIEWFNGDDFGQ